MSKYVLINVQGLHDITTKVFNEDKKLYDYLLDFFEDEGDYTPDDLIPSGTVYLDGQTLEVLEINC